MQVFKGNRPELPHSPSCERNKHVILDVLRDYVTSGHEVLEVGSGTGQHAVFFGEQFPEVRWQPSDTGDYLEVLKLRLKYEGPANVIEPIELNVHMESWSQDNFDLLFSANTLHFMGRESVRAFFRGVGDVLLEEGVLIVYGPFNYNGAYSSQSNADFDIWLKSTDPARAIKDFDWVDDLAREQGLTLLQDVTMPANNRMLIWRKATGS
jgi:cyclopropane fatty-acyl-phospholipid synthase-like methyltransferase